MNKFKNVENKILEIIEKNFFTGAVIQINQNKKTIFSYSYGINDIDKQTFMNEDLIFRGYSLTKTVTVASFLTLIDKKIISLDDKLSKFFPEFTEMKVLNKEGMQEINKSNNPILIKHLLTMTSGFTYFGNKNITQKETTKLLAKFVEKENDTYINYETFMKMLSNIPLEFEPGTNWRYGISLDVLAAVIEKVTKRKFSDFVKETIFEPLEMNDSDFYLKDKNREAKVYSWNLIEDKPTLTKVENFNFLFQEIDKIPQMPMGGAGIFTTVKDYSKFLDFLLDGKDSKGNQILSSHILNEMKSDQLKEIRKYFKWTLNDEYSYGYGVRVRMENTNYPLTEIGEFGWDGLLGSTGLADPKNKFTVCLMLSSKPGHNKLIESEFFDSLYKDLANYKY
ncbi:serine hydrolase domain-containing protein [Spiroplasma diminutum]|uniref:Transmembrane protein n=1 Tax=Spiroplasma diminutum CUAS-1 TaxID=1276221 RepID=S5M189_9MOLU|nr:serine hydrolase domain-containing protein [Spiroplasma diminutum]AGR41802.1 transmembrane protein [Spiroplasma diminutum CUAS-1]